MACASRRPCRARLPKACTAPAQACRRRAVTVDDGCKHVALAARDVGQHLGEQLGLGGEVAVDGAGGDAGLLGHRGDVRVAPAAFGDQIAGGGQDARPVVLEAGYDRGVRR